MKLEPTLSQSLHLLNGDTTTQKIAAGNLIGQRLAEKKTPPQIIEELYLRCLSRKPTAKETARLIELIAPEPDKKQGAGGRLLGAAELARVHVQPLTSANGQREPTGAAEPATVRRPRRLSHQPAHAGRSPS